MSNPLPFSDLALEELFSVLRQSPGPGRCGGRQRHRSLERARAHARALCASPSLEVNPYRCPDCRGWHIEVVISDPVGSAPIASKPREKYKGVVSL